MCASARNMMLRSTNHVCKCKKHDVFVAPIMCASARNMMLRSTDHVCKCKERYHPHPTPPPTSCVASTMSTPGEPPVPRDKRYYPPGKESISHLGKRKIIDSKVPWEGICDLSQEGYTEKRWPRFANNFFGHDQETCWRWPWLGNLSSGKHQDVILSGFCSC